MAVPAEIRRNTTLVVVAAALYLLLQMVLAGFARPLGMYERALFDSIATEDLWVVRLGMMVVSAAGLLVAFRTWVRPGGKASWAAAGFFAVSWAPVVYGGEIRPELPAALAAIAAAGTTTRWLVERDRAALVGAGAAVGIAVVLMPTVGTVLAVALAALIGVWARAGGGLAFTAIGAGLVAGRLLASLLRAGARGTMVATAEAQRGEGGLARLYLALDPSGGPSAQWRAGAGAMLIAALVVLAIVWWRWPHRRNAARTGTALALAMLVAGLLSPHGAPSAFLPAYGLLAIPVGAGLLAAWRATRETGSFIATMAYVVVVLSFVVWQAVGTITAARA